MVRLGGVARRRTYARIGFLDQIIGGKLFVLRIAPELLADPLVEIFGEGFGKTVSQRLEHYGGVIVIGLLEPLGDLVLGITGRDGEPAYPVGDIAAYEVRDGQIGLVAVLFRLLTQAEEGADLLLAGFIGKHSDIITVSFRRPQTGNPSGF